MSTTQPIFITDAEVKNILTWPMVIEAVEEALKSVVQTEINLNSNRSFVNQPPRSFTFTENHKGVLLTMPGFVGNHQLSKEIKQKTNTLACKLVTSFSKNENHQPPLAKILANILLFNSETGQLQCIMDGTHITAWRTAAASIVATKYLYFHRWTNERNIILAIIGCGVQGQSHSLGMCCTFNVTKIYLWNRTKSKAEKLGKLLETQKSQFRNQKLQISIAKDISECVADADVIFIGTSSAESLLDYKMLKKKSIHINAVGAGQIHHGEVGQNVYDNAKTYIDYWPDAKIELKTLKADIVCEIGEVINEQKFPKEKEITIFQSLGIAAEDALVAQAIFEKIQNKK